MCDRDLVRVTVREIDLVELFVLLGVRVVEVLSLSVWLGFIVCDAVRVAVTDRLRVAVEVAEGSTD